jgi:hypothetical protein
MSAHIKVFFNFILFMGAYFYMMQYPELSLLIVDATVTPFLEEAVPFIQKAASPILSLITQGSSV